MVKADLAEKRRVKMFSENKLWSVSIFPFNKHSVLVGAYITPQANSDDINITQMLQVIERQIAKYDTVFIGGDFNAATGTNARAILNRWTEDNGLRLQNSNLPTHISPQGNTSDIDLVFTRNLTTELNKIEVPTKGHVRMTFLANFPAVNITPPKCKINWHLLTLKEEEYNRKVAELLNSGMDYTAALREAGQQVLGMTQTYSRRIGRVPRRIVRRERRLLKRLDRGSPEYAACLDRIEAVFARYANRGWKKKLKRLRKKPFDREGWRIVKCLSRPPIHPAVGLAEHEVAEKIEEIYTKNNTNRPEWTLRRVYPANSHENSAQDEPFTATEIIEAIEALPLRKASGIDEVPYEALKACRLNPALIAELVLEFNTFLFGGYNVQRIETVIVPIAKNNGEDIRPISLLPTKRKLLEKVVTKRVLNLGDHLHESQSGFRAKMSPLRALLRIQLDIMEARWTKGPLIIKSYDVMKAFDSIPKALLASRFKQYIGNKAPLLGQLIHDMLITPIVTSIDDKIIELKTGIPQGGIISPLAYNVAEDMLGRMLGDRLTKFADDNTLICKSDEEIELAESILLKHYDYSGCRINPDKTQTLHINNDHTQGNTEEIRILGATMDYNGIQLKVTTNMFTDLAPWIIGLTRANGLTIEQGLHIARAKCWAKIAYATPIALPDARTLTLAWIRLCRIIFCTYQTANTLRIVEACGALYNPYWWAVEATIKFYRKSLTDNYLERRIRQNEATSGSLDHKVSRFLEPAGITWTDLRGTEATSTLIHRAKTCFVGWLAVEIERDAARLGIEAREPLRMYPARYTSHELGKYGYPFLQDHMGPPNLSAANCFLCGAVGKDTGRHLTRECPSVPMRPTATIQDWELPNKLSRRKLTTLLKWMQDTWTLRKRAFKRAGEPRAPPRNRVSASKFLKGRGLSTNAAFTTGQSTVTMGQRRIRSASAAGLIESGGAQQRPRLTPPSITGIPMTDSYEVVTRNVHMETSEQRETGQRRRRQREQTGEPLEPPTSRQRTYRRGRRIRNPDEDTDIPPQTKRRRPNNNLTQAIPESQTIQLARPIEDQDVSPQAGTEIVTDPRDVGPWDPPPETDEPEAPTLPEAQDHDLGITQQINQRRSKRARRAPQRYTPEDHEPARRSRSAVRNEHQTSNQPPLRAKPTGRTKERRTCLTGPSPAARAVELRRGTRTRKPPQRYEPETGHEAGLHHRPQATPPQIQRGTVTGAWPNSAATEEKIRQTKIPSTHSPDSPPASTNEAMDALGTRAPHSAPNVMNHRETRSGEEHQDLSTRPPAPLETQTIDKQPTKGVEKALGKRTAAPRWTHEEMERLVEIMNHLPNPYDYKGLQIFLPHRSVPGITAKMNAMYRAGRIQHDGAQYILHSS